MDSNVNTNSHQTDINCSRSDINISSEWHKNKTNFRPYCTSHVRTVSYKIAYLSTRDASELKIRWVSRPEVYKHVQNTFSFIFKETTPLQYLSRSRISILECELRVSVTYTHVTFYEKVLSSVT